jgi:hypothetical protein
MGERCWIGCFPNDKGQEDLIYSHVFVAASTSQLSLVELGRALAQLWSNFSSITFPPECHSTGNCSAHDGSDGDRLRLYSCRNQQLSLFMAGSIKISVCCIQA